jgi:hypothetical protein
MKLTCVNVCILSFLYMSQLCIFKLDLYLIFVITRVMCAGIIVAVIYKAHANKSTTLDFIRSVTISLWLIIVHNVW